MNLIKIAYFAYNFGITATLADCRNWNNLRGDLDKNRTTD